MPRIIPNLCHHRSSEQGFAKFDGRTIYFGKWPRGEKAPPERVVNAYLDHVAAWITRRRFGLPEKPPTVAKVVAAFLKKHPGTHEEFRGTCERLVASYGDELADGFTPYMLHTLQLEMVRAKFTRQHINRQIKKVGEMFRWAVEQKMVNVVAWMALKVVSSLKRGRTSAPEE